MGYEFAIIIIFLSISFVFAGFLITNTVPQIFKNTEISNKTLDKINQTQLLLHEDQARLNQTIHEDQARDEQRVLIAKENNKSIIVLRDNLTSFIKISQKQHELAEQQRNLIQQDIFNIQKNMNETLDLLLQITKSDSLGAQAHRNLTKNAAMVSLEHTNMTSHNHEIIISILKHLDKEIKAIQ